MRSQLTTTTTTYNDDYRGTAQTYTGADSPDAMGATVQRHSQKWA